MFAYFFEAVGTWDTTIADFLSVTYTHNQKKKRLESTMDSGRRLGGRKMHPYPLPDHRICKSVGS